MILIDGHFHEKINIPCITIKLGPVFFFFEIIIEKLKFTEHVEVFNIKTKLKKNYFVTHRVSRKKLIYF